MVNPIEPMPLVGMLLAGGRSRRMGRDKATLPFRGTSLGDFMVNLLREAGAERVIVSGHLPGHEVIADRILDRGPLMGIATVADELFQEGMRGLLLVVPVDMPALRAPVLQRLAETLRTRRLLNAARYEERELPACFRLDEPLLQALGELLSEQLPPSRASVAALHDRLNAASLPRRRRDEDCFVNLNAPDEWRDFLDRHA